MDSVSIHRFLLYPHTARDQKYVDAYRGSQASLAAFDTQPEDGRISEAEAKDAGGIYEQEYDELTTSRSGLASRLHDRALLTSLSIFSPGSMLNPMNWLSVLRDTGDNLRG